MSTISAAAVKALREKTQLPMMECKRALEESGGDEERAIRWLREQGKKTMEKRFGRATEAGRLAVYTSTSPAVGAMVELQCESAPVSALEEFQQLAQDLARQLALGPAIQSADELWNRPSPSRSGQTLGQQRDDLQNRIREVFRLERVLRIDGPCGGYVHHTGADAVLLHIEGGSAELAKDISMHIAAMRPRFVRREEIPRTEIEKERGILTAQAQSEGRPANILEKMVEGRMRNFFAEQVLFEQPFVKDEKQTVGQLAQAGGAKVVRFVHWRLGRKD
jgi:elongation factor Ts